MYNHPEYHENSEQPVLNCPLCDKEINRPLQLKHGLGSSSVVIGLHSTLKPTPQNEINKL